MPSVCSLPGVSRVRISTTVDGERLAAARVITGPSDIQLLDSSLRALLNQQRSIAIDALYSAYDEFPIPESDEWGDLEHWHSAADASRA